MYGQPMYGQPMYPPPPPQQGPMIINMGGNNNSNGGTNCPVCGHETGNIARKKVGSVTITCCLVLLFLTGVCWWIPFCTDSCKDTELVCVKCQTVKSAIPANLC